MTNYYVLYVYAEQSARERERIYGIAVIIVSFSITSSYRNARTRLLIENPPGDTRKSVVASNINCAL